MENVKGGDITTNPVNQQLSSLGGYTSSTAGPQTTSYLNGVRNNSNESHSWGWSNLTNEEFMGEYPYPSNYSWLHIIISSLVVTFIILVIILGNTLVIVAIARDNNLKGLQNWFIASLAVSDLLLGLLIMPFSLANELMGYWYFGTILCQMWLSIDVLLCTASILNLCLISLDRYWSITRAVSYVRNRTKKRAVIMITTVWILSAIICFPPLVGWKRPQKQNNGFPLCLLSEEPGYVVYSTLGSFYIPLIVMVIVYFKIYLAARERARRNLKKKQVVPPQCKQSTSTSSTVKENHSPKLKDSFERLQPISDSDCGILDKASGYDSTALSDSCNDTSRGIKMAVINQKRRLGHTDEHKNLLCEDTDAVDSTAEVSLKAHMPHSKGFSNMELTSDSETCNYQCSARHNGYSALRITHNTNEKSNSQAVSENEKTSDCNERNKCPTGDSCEGDKVVLVDSKQQTRTVPSLKIITTNNEQEDCMDHHNIKSPSPDFGEIGSPDSRKDLLSPNNNIVINSFRPQTKLKKRSKERKNTDDPEKLKRKIARAKERRATLVLGIIMATFILCWLPFFSTYLISTLADFQIPELVFAVMFWGGYCNSALNPIIYTIFNRDFRLAFQKILFGRRWSGYYN